MAKYYDYWTHGVAAEIEYPGAGLTDNAELNVRMRFFESIGHSIDESTVHESGTSRHDHPLLSAPRAGGRQQQ